MTQHNTINQYSEWLQQLNKTNSVVSCMLVDGRHGKVIAYQGSNLDISLTGLINTFYASASRRDVGEQLIASKEYYHLTRILDKKNRLFVHVVVKKRKAYLPLIRLKISNFIMSTSFSSILSRKIPTAPPFSYSQSI